MELDWSYLLKSMLVDIVVLFVLNALLALSAPEVIPYTREDIFNSSEISWGARTLVEELFWSSFFIGYFMSLYITNGVRFDLLGSKVDPPEWYRHQIPYLRRFPRNLFLRSLFIGIIALFLFFPVSCIICEILALESLTYWDFVVFKGFYSALIGAPLGLLIRIVALGD